MRKPSPLGRRNPRAQNLPRLPPAPVVRMFLLAMVAVIGCAWALVRYYSRPRTPMVIPAAPSSSEIPVEMEAP